MNRALGLLLTYFVLHLFAPLYGAETEAQRAAAASLLLAKELEQTLQRVVEQHQALTPTVQARLSQWRQAEQADPKRTQPWISTRYHLYRLVHLFGALTEQDSDYRATVQELIERLDKHDKKAFNVFFRVQNALYRSVEMSGLWAAKKGMKRNEIDDIFARLRYGDEAAKTAIQQSQNGAYRLVEILAPIALLYNVPKDRIAQVNETFAANNKAAPNLYRQIENGLSCSQVLLALIAEQKP
jgi:hypothetical protein